MRAQYAPEKNISSQDTNLTHPSKRLSPRNRNLGPNDADLGPRAPGPQKRDLEGCTRNHTSQDRYSQDEPFGGVLKTFGNVLSACLIPSAYLTARDGWKM